MRSSGPSGSGKDRGRGLERFFVAREKDNRGGIVVAFVNAGCLWWLAWVQWVLVLWFGTPMFRMHGNADLALSLYRELDRFGLSLPSLFLMVSLGFGLMAVVSTWWFNRERPAKWRLSMLVVFFASLCIGFSWSVTNWRSHQAEVVKQYREWVRKESDETFGGEEFRMELLEHLDGLLLENEKKE